MAFTTLHDRVFIRQASEREKTASSLLFIPEQAKKKPAEGKVMAVGQGRLLDSGTLVPLQVKVGDTVAFNQGAGIETEIDGETFLMMREGEIIAILGPKDKHADRKRNLRTS